MGDDWCRMRVKTQNYDEVRDLVAKEVEAFQRWGWGFLQDLYPLLENRALTDEAREEAKAEWLQANAAVCERLDIEEFDASASFPNCTRMSSIGRNDIFPGEWRIEAYRTFLPDEVQNKLSQWRGYLVDVMEGKYRKYLLEWYLYAYSQDAQYLYEELTGGADYAEKRGEEWFDELKMSSDLVKEIRDPSLAPILHSVPRWNDWKEFTREVKPEQDERYVQLQVTTAHLEDVRLRWNAIVPHEHPLPQVSWQINYPLSGNLENFIARANLDNFDDIFSWLEQCVKDGVGLYLWV